MRAPRLPIPVQTLLVYACACAVFLHITFGAPGIFTDDGFYHYRVASQLTLLRPWVDITSLPYTVLGAHGADHHWLWHVLVAPLTRLTRDDFTGLRIAIALTGALVPLAIFLAAHKWTLPAPWLVTLLAVSAVSDLPGRYLMLCAQNLAIVFVLAYLVLCVQARHAACALVAMLFMQSYHGAIILLPLAAIACLLPVYYRGQPDFRIVVATLAGLTLGLVANPWFPDTFRYLYFHLAHKVLVHTPMAVGTEWHSISLRDSLPLAWIAHLSLAGAFAMIAIRATPAANTPPVRLETAILVLFALFCLPLYLYASRFSEYYGPIAVLAAALVFRDCGTRWSAPLRTACALALALLLAWRLPSTVSELAAGGANTEGKYAEVNAYLARHANAGDMVFNLRWDDYVYLFWKNPQLHYVNGLDPNYLAQGSPDKYAIWAVYAVAQLPDVPDHALTIREHFAARWIVVDFLYQPLIDALVADPHARLVAGGAHSLLFEIVE